MNMAISKENTRCRSWRQLIRSESRKYGKQRHPKVRRVEEEGDLPKRSSYSVPPSRACEGESVNKITRCRKSLDPREE